MAMPKSPYIPRAKPARDYLDEAAYDEPGPQPGPKPVAHLRTTEIIHREEPVFADGTGTFGQMIDLQIDAAMNEGRQLLSVELEISEEHWAAMLARR